MRIKLVLSTTSPKQHKPIELKINVPPTQQIGFINFINAALQGDSPVILSFEKASADKKERSKIKGEFKLFQSDQDKKQG